MSTAAVIWDVFRFIDLCLWVVGTGIAASTMIAYGTVYAKRHDNRERRKSAGLLPLHVWVIALSWIVLAGSAAAANMQRLGEGFTMFIPVNLAGFGLGVFALVTILRYERRRVNPPDPRVQDTITLPHEEEVFGRDDDPAHP